MKGQRTLSLLIAVVLLIYEIWHGCLNVWMRRYRAHRIMPSSLWTTSVSVAGTVPACVPFVGRAIRKERGL